KLIPFLFRSFCNWLIFKLKKIGGTKTGSQLATLFVTFSSAQPEPAEGPEDQTECKNGYAQAVTAVTEFLLLGNHRRNY
ncbi:MAG: hypothetical protein DRI57_30355, partial [Deltaproteobacteria bacterium]